MEKIWALVKWIEFRWSIFSYNYHWSDFGLFFHGNMARVAAFVPLFGYLILFNDGISHYLTFEKLAPIDDGFAFISTEGRLRLVYFGLLSLGIAEMVYLIRRPYVIRFGSDLFAYKAKVLSLASPRYFSEIHRNIRNSGFDPSTQGGKYYDRDFEDFIELCTGAKPGDSLKQAYENGRKASWDEAVRRFEPLLTGMLEEHYFNEGVKRRGSLTVAIFLALIGYFLLALPSIELMIRVVRITFLQAFVG